MELPPKKVTCNIIWVFFSFNYFSNRGTKTKTHAQVFLISINLRLHFGLNITALCKLYQLLTTVFINESLKDTTILAQILLTTVSATAFWEMSQSHPSVKVEDRLWRKT